MQPTFELRYRLIRHKLRVAFKGAVLALLQCRLLTDAHHSAGAEASVSEGFHPGTTVLPNHAAVQRHGHQAAYVHTQRYMHSLSMQSSHRKHMQCTARQVQYHLSQSGLTCIASGNHEMREVVRHCRCKPGYGVVVRYQQHHNQTRLAAL